MLTHGILTAIRTSYFSSLSLAPFSEHPLRHRVLKSPLQAWQPRSIFPGYPHPRSFLQLLSLLFTLNIFPCVECRIHQNRDFSPKIQCLVIWISKVLQSLTRRESRDSFPTWNARNASSWMATANYDVRWPISHRSWRINPYPLDS